MRSQAQIEASRRNGARSRGPVTLQGKAVARLNSTRHGLLSQSVVMTGEDPAEFHALLQDFVRRLLPADNAELAYVEQMVSALWRLRRAEAIEVAILNQIVGAPVDDPRLAALAAATPDLERLRRYQQRLLRDHRRAAKDLADLRATSAAATPDPPSDPLPNEPEPAPPPSVPNEPGAVPEYEAPPAPFPFEQAAALPDPDAA
jgi:hypothetical protein